MEHNSSILLSNPFVVTESCSQLILTIKLVILNKINAASIMWTENKSDIQTHHVLVNHIY